MTLRRTGPPVRKTALKPGKGFKADPKPLARSTLKPARRPVNQVSDKKRAANELKPPIREAVFARDGYRCKLADVAGAGRCFGGLTPHHIRKEGQGGAYVESNLVTLCSSHNDRIEAEADLAALARSLGYVKRRGDA